jgi:hypothetical protein
LTCSQSGPCCNNPCKNGGTCISQPSFQEGFSCSCPSNFYGLNCSVSSTLCGSQDSNIILCPIWASNGFCNDQYQYNSIPIPVYCPISCKTCNQNLACQDSQANCVFWANTNSCSLLNSINQNLCKKSCGSC